jgi:hypothetical protein
MTVSLTQSAQDVPPVEARIARDMLRRGIPLLIVLFAFCTIVWRANGAASSGYAIAIVTFNFAFSAWIASTVGRISTNALLVSTLVGYLVRMTAVGVAVFVVRDATWVNWYALCLSLVVSHLGLLAVELRHISATLAFPDLKPSSKGRLSA